MEENRDIPADSQQARHMSGANLKLLVPSRPSDDCRLMSDPRQDQIKLVDKAVHFLPLDY